MRLAGAIALASAWLAASAVTVAAAPPTGPSHCRASEVRSTLVAYAVALNRGDYGALDEIFAAKPDFQWYSTDGRSGRAARRRDNLIRYFRARHRRGERLGLARFRFTGNSPHYGNFEMTVRRSIRGFRRGRWERIPGKGAAICTGGATRLIVISFGSVPGR
jgi:hypothetical protein